MNWFVAVTLFKCLSGNEFGGFAEKLETRVRMEGTQMKSR
jgi:hypothetical protein